MEHKHYPVRMKISDIFTVHDTLPADAEKALTEYLSHFAAPVLAEDGSQVCVGCGEKANAFKHFFGTGVAYEWGLAYGEAHCSGCGWPARGHHEIKADDGSVVVSLRNAFLCYHPDEVTTEAA